MNTSADVGFIHGGGVTPPCAEVALCALPEVHTPEAGQNSDTGVSTRCGLTAAGRWSGVWRGFHSVFRIFMIVVSVVLFPFILLCMTGCGQDDGSHAGVENHLSYDVAMGNGKRNHDIHRVESDSSAWSMTNAGRDSIKKKIQAYKDAHKEDFRNPFKKPGGYKPLSREEQNRKSIQLLFDKFHPRQVVEFFAVILFAISAIFSVLGKRCIKHSRSAKTAVNIRRAVGGVRVVFVVLFCSIWVYVLYYLISSPWWFAVAVILTVPVAAKFWEEKGWLGNLSFLTKQKFLDEHDRYVLYLRGFGDDTLNDDLGLGLEGENRGEAGMFDEEELFKKIGEKTTVCAVGRPQELDAPHGAERVYLDDVTWKDDVLGLMEKATCIVIKINDRDSCVWEIMQAQGFLYKTVFVVDNASVYQKVIDKLASSNYLLTSLTYEYCYLYKSPESHEWIVVEIQDRQISQLSCDLERIFL